MDRQAATEFGASGHGRAAAGERDASACSDHGRSPPPRPCMSKDDALYLGHTREHAAKALDLTAGKWRQDFAAEDVRRTAQCLGAAAVAPPG